MSKTRVYLTLAIILFPAIVVAQSKILDPIGSATNLGLPGASTTTIGGEIFAFIKYFLQIVGLITVGYVLYGGFRYVTAGSNEENSKQAKKTILNAIIGLVVIIFSYIIVAVVSNAAFGRL